jgi:hypothetical protein
MGLVGWLVGWLADVQKLGRGEFTGTGERRTYLSWRRRNYRNWGEEKSLD